MQTISVIVGEPIIRERLVYVLDFLENHPLCPDGVKFEIAEEASGGGFEIFCPLRPLKGKRFASPDLEFEIGKNSLLGGEEHDFFEVIFFHISRYEEIFCKKNQLDAHGRMRSEEMFLVKNGLEKTPIVDLLVVAFFEKLGLKTKSHPTEFHMSHDIDILLKFPSFLKVIKAFAGMILKQRSLGGLLKLMRQYFRFLIIKKDPFDTYDWLFTNKNFKTKTVYILPEGTVPRIEQHFKLNDPKVREFIDLAKSRGYEIGLHPSYHAGFDESLFFKEKEKLGTLIGEKLTQTRQHFLRWDWSTTPQIIEKSGLKIDSTLGFPDRIGFRCGTGFPYKLYDFENERAFDFLEIPMIVMDVSLLRESENFEVSLTDFLNQNKMNTAITFNFHNSVFDDVYVDAEKLKALYRNLFL